MTMERCSQIAGSATILPWTAILHGTYTERGLMEYDNTNRRIAGFLVPTTKAIQELGRGPEA